MKTKSTDKLAMQLPRQRGPAPVHLWDPPLCGAIDMRIGSDGTWYHEGRPIRRSELVQLFSNVLKREGEQYFLVTPVEKLAIQVDDCPYFARELEAEGKGSGQTLVFVLNTGELVRAGREHPIRLGPDNSGGEPHPVLHVRDGLHALIGRNVFYRLVELAACQDASGAGPLGVWSGGEFYPLEPG